MGTQEIKGLNSSYERSTERKAYETPELKQLGTIEELTRWGASVTVGE
jgi:hypothetical protein